MSNSEFEHRLGRFVDTIAAGETVRASVPPTIAARACGVSCFFRVRIT